jgi:hypothetical protein
VGLFKESKLFFNKVPIHIQIRSVFELEIFDSFRKVVKESMTKICLTKRLWEEILVLFLQTFNI